MPTWFYKDGKGELFDSSVCPEGYTDHPNKQPEPVKTEKPKVVKAKKKKVSDSEHDH